MAHLASVHLPLAAELDHSPPSTVRSENLQRGAARQNRKRQPELKSPMLSLSSLREKFPFHPVNAGIGGLILISAVALLVKAHYEPNDKDSSKPKVHRPDSTLPLLENTLDFIRAARDGDIHDRTVEVCSQFNGEPILFRSIGMPDQLVVSSPEAFEEVLKIQFSNFPKGSYMCENLEDLLGGGIFAADGGQWVHQRKTASNLFISLFQLHALRSILFFPTLVLLFNHPLVDLPFFPGLDQSATSFIRNASFLKLPLAPDLIRNTLSNFFTSITSLPAKS